MGKSLNISYLSLIWKQKAVLWLSTKGVAWAQSSHWEAVRVCTHSSLALLPAELAAPSHGHAAPRGAWPDTAPAESAAAWERENLKYGLRKEQSEPGYLLLFLPVPKGFFRLFFFQCNLSRLRKFVGSCWNISIYILCLSDAQIRDIWSHTEEVYYSYKYNYLVSEAEYLSIKI